MLRSRGFLTATVILGLVAFVGGCGGNSDQDLDQARQEGAKEARDQAKLDQLESEVNRLQKQGKSGSGDSESGGSGSSTGSGAVTNPSGPVQTCAAGVRAGPNTSCPFAMNVAGEYGSNPGATSIRAYSPTTGQFYVMSCSAWSGGGTVCQGGNNASVYLP